MSGPNTAVSDLLQFIEQNHSYQNGDIFIRYEDYARLKHAFLEGEK